MRLILYSEGDVEYMMGQGYQLSVIENDGILRSTGHGMAYRGFWLALVVALAVAALVSVYFYLTRCRGYRKRIRELDLGGGEYRGWNVRRLEETVAELELDLAAVSFSSAVT